jgi:hypothetical protein
LSDQFREVRAGRAGLRAAIGHVESASASPVPGRATIWSSELHEQLDLLSSALDHHVTMTEGPDGLLADVMAAAPRLAHKVDGVRKDHTRIRRQVDAVLACLPAEESRVAPVRDQVVDLLTNLTRHRQAGADLIYEAYSIDIEAAD